MKEYAIFQIWADFIWYDLAYLLLMILLIYGCIFLNEQVNTWWQNRSKSALREYWKNKEA